MPHVARERRQQRLEIDVLPVPERQPKDGEGVAQIVEAERSPTDAARDAGIGDDLMEGVAKRRDRIDPAGWCRKEGDIGSALAQTGDDQTVAALEPCNDIGGNRD
jgi:hypothetical protein